MNKLLIVLALAVVGSMGLAAYLYVREPQVQTSSTVEMEVGSEAEEAQLVGNDADENGCIGSAGYTWCEPLGKCLRTFEEPCVAEGTDTKTLEAAVKAQIVAKRGAGAEDLVITTREVAGDYARGSAQSLQPEAGGGMWFVANVEGEWQLVWDGNGTIACTDLTDYPDFPTGMIPECYDESAGDMIVR